MLLHQLFIVLLDLFMVEVKWPFAWFLVRISTLTADKEVKVQIRPLKSLEMLLFIKIGQLNMVKINSGNDRQSD